jgi:hypothetical protein
MLHYVVLFMQGYIAFTHSFIHLAFLLCLSAAAFSAIAFAGSETFFFFGFLGFAFLVDYSMDVSNLDVRYPRFHLIVQFAIKIPAIVVFFALAENAKPIVVFVSYLSIALYINLVLDHFERYRITSDNVIFTTIYAVVFFLATAVSFGALVYGDVSRKIGGGRYMEANIAMTKEFSGLFDGEGQSPPESEVKVIHVTDKHMFIEVNGKTIRIPESAVKWLVLKKPG